MDPGASARNRGGVLMATTVMEIGFVGLGKMGGNMA
jgi:hypothetical protein